MAKLQLTHLFASSVDEALGSCSEQAFCDGFNLPAEHAQVLARAHQQATDKLRGNALAELNLISDEHGVDAALGRLDSLKAERPLLPDGSRCLVAAPKESALMLNEAAQPARRRHVQAMRSALEQARGSLPAVPSRAPFGAAIRLPSAALAPSPEGACRCPLPPGPAPGLQIDQENAELERQLAEQRAAVTAEVGACSSTFQQTAEACEQWRDGLRAT
ncbi:hypothetical protein EMIHUDRAFT_234971 [Emiliania huxleyi CCMP1516]|uniref:Uncharacterized protein n=2 Tax=Emiliania huxleyi TaxID=2903 RepID=A0A0D3JXI0_EMIH1|nr:hypothetical protein EMIHUDRAFT_248488 [Emiliania huxleyi CCMP1516]XP_005780644.1 hypothetical protein EMIHUDRAFT_234971 [Emiliania huxleyi CCMP1516]EOD10160.1 hypothetical protein EMIHUDRAFT_248488 [Emiliania huxleyi CCMP1516]EOD28215.1 hypothetical protein EMIHUDRAFT_234971 [Emiliania huxleyi CCMP1516]|eukprot:XP_005762589.1 hypothetical protein EMIHUDRAFT_248488 [Emiliania huxleyi CCMP1516]